jgi:hypothetical protein
MSSSWCSSYLTRACGSIFCLYGTARPLSRTERLGQPTQRPDATPAKAGQISAVDDSLRRADRRTSRQGQSEERERSPLAVPPAGAAAARWAAVMSEASARAMPFSRALVVFMASRSDKTQPTPDRTRHKFHPSSFIARPRAPRLQTIQHLIRCSLGVASCHNWWLL